MNVWKRLGSALLILLMVGTLCAGATEGVVLASHSAMEEEIHIPETTGLYMRMLMDWDHDKIRTTTDKNGNVLLWSGAYYFNYFDWYDPDYLTTGVREGWGLAPLETMLDNMWIDYVENGKIIHVTAKDLVLTNLDGSPVEPEVASLSAHPIDERLVSLKTPLYRQKFLLTYPAGKTNNRFVLEVDGTAENFFATKEPSRSSVLEYEDGDIFVPEGGTRTIYFALEKHDTVQFIPESLEYQVGYQDEVRGKEVSLEPGEDGASDFISVGEGSTVSASGTDWYVYPITLRDPKLSGGPGLSQYHVTMFYGESETNGKMSSAEVQILRPRTLTAAPPEGIQYDNTRYDMDYGTGLSDSPHFISVNESPVYTMFRYYDEKGDNHVILNPADITVYEKKNGSLIKADPSDVEISLDHVFTTALRLVPHLKGDSAVTYVLGYRDVKPDISNDKGITLEVGHSSEVDLGLYSSADISDATAFSSIEVGDTKDLTFYAASLEDGSRTKAEIKSASLVITDTLDDTYKVPLSVDSGAPVKTAGGAKTAGSAAIRIPKKVLPCDCVLTVNAEITRNGKTYPRTVYAVIHLNSSVPIIKRITMEQSKLTLKAGKKRTLTICVMPSSASENPVKFTSSNTKYLTVKQDGDKAVITAKKAGIGRKVKVTVKAQDGSNKSAVCTVTIKK